LRLGVARGLREGGHTADARALLNESGAATTPAFATERALNDLRDGPPARALPGLRVQAAETPESAYRYAEALFFSGQTDSAHAWYLSAASDPRSETAGAALERLYLLEEKGGQEVLPAFGRLAYEDWRGNRPVARALADSLFRTLARGPLWAYAAVLSGNFRAAAGDPQGALEPLLAVADSLPEDRLAPLARQRAGDIYLDALKDDRAAAQQYEMCLTRYPRAWNAPEVRRRLDQLRRDRRL
jgi:tetratricopeptide (TPR) repeat protein